MREEFLITEYSIRSLGSKLRSCHLFLREQIDRSDYGYASGFDEQVDRVSLRIQVVRMQFIGIYVAVALVRALSLSPITRRFVPLHPINQQKAAFSTVSLVKENCTNVDL